MSVTPTSKLSPVTTVALTVGLASSVFALTATAAVAQQALPGIVVQGATLDPPPLKQAAPKPEVVEPDPAPTAKPQAAPREAAASPPPSAPASAQPSQTPATPPSATSGAAAAPAGPATSVGGDGAGTANGDGSDGVAGIAADRTGTSTTVVTRADLERGQVRNGAEALRSLPGVSVSRSGGFGSFTQVRIRGMEGRHTKVLIDGIEANDATNGEFDFSDLGTADIERIEVIRGAQSGLYGSGAGGGIINIITRSGRGPMRVTATVEGGSFATKNVAASISGGSDRIWGSVTASQNSTQGFNIAPLGTEKDGAQLTTVSGKVGVAIADGLVLTLNARHTRKRADYDEFGCDFDPVTFGCRNGPLGTAYDYPSTLDHSMLLLGGTLQWDMLGGALTHILKASHNETSRMDKGLDYVSQNDSKRRKLGYSATYRFDTPTAFGGVRHFVTGLVERETEAFRPSSDYGFGFASDNLTHDRSLVAGVAEYRAEVANRLFLAANVRRDDSSAFGAFDTWRTSASLKLPQAGSVAFRPHASVGTGLKLPTLFEQYGTIKQFTSNPNLKPERMFGWDAGLETTLTGTGLSLDVTYFNTKLKDKIGTEFLPNFTTTAVNVDGISSRQGVELAGRWAMTPTLSFGAAYTFTDARTPNGVREIRRPPHTARGDVNWLFASGKGTLNLALVYNGRDKDLAFVNDFPYGTQRVTLDPYWLGTVAASYKLQPGLEVFGRVENALNQRYQEVYGYNTPGIAAYAGVKVTLEEKPRIGQE